MGEVRKESNLEIFQEDSYGGDGTCLYAGAVGLVGGKGDRGRGCERLMVREQEEMLQEGSL